MTAGKAPAGRFTSGSERRFVNFMLRTIRAEDTSERPAKVAQPHAFLVDGPIVLKKFCLVQTCKDSWETVARKYPKRAAKPSRSSETSITVGKNDRDRHLRSSTKLLSS
ncbi:hypothetical protein PUNSTDRAFT_53937 [Punctularia strigosozonata HHB-11173 SS5]|uniref:uncharacterized protein n=1 Tax=Punctularia strigosozonata (strain HHB-11173) TaxID=741275 RepID=UPI000441775A|nr:uncharacterized protein PUNSTDRAFT_53937 [Punctularia strigosozonata HHB-11173 SS5]EIN06490.1 hypothetical protein PUNSTDRAFT_53937 [Punctularia strigosozonata HHB-11173 SS5]